MRPRAALWAHVVRPIRSASTGHRARVPITCGDRLCYDCTRHTERTHRAKLRALVQHEAERGQAHNLRTIILTVRNAPIGQLRRRRLDLVAAFRRLRQTADWKAHTESWASAEEVTGSVEKGWHPHLNVVVLGTFWEQHGLAKLWERVTKGVGKIVWIGVLVRGIPTPENLEGGIQEAVKYLVKSQEVRQDWSEGMRFEFRKAYRKVRIFSTGGRWRGLVLDDIDALSRPQTLFGDLEPQRGNCPECGGFHDDWKPAGRPISLFDASALGYFDLWSYDPERRIPADEPPCTDTTSTVWSQIEEDIERQWQAGLFTDSRFKGGPARKKKKRRTCGCGKCGTTPVH